MEVPRELLEELVEKELCWYDHHGGCQAHGYLSLEPGEVCPMLQAQRLLEASPVTDAGTPT